MSRSESPWLTDLPYGWHTAKLGHVATVGTGSADVQDSDPNGIYPFVVRSPKLLSLGNYTHDTEAVLTAGDGNVGEIFHHLKGKFAAHQRVYVIKPGRSLHGRFLYYVMRGSFLSSLQGNTAKSTVESLRRPMLTGFSIPLPSMHLQQQVADYLDHETVEIDALINNFTHLQNLLLESLDSRRLRLFTPIASSDTLRIKRVAAISNGSGFPPALQGDPSQEIPFYKVGSLRYAHDGCLADSPDSISNDTARQIGATVFPPHTITMAKIGAALFLNRQAMTTRASCLDNNMMGLIPNHLVIPRFLMHALANIDVTPLANPGAVPSLNVNWYRNLEIWVPSRARQKIALDGYEAHRILIEATLADISESTRLARERRAALITAAVTGQIDVTARNKPAAEQLEDDIAQGLHREN